MVSKVAVMRQCVEMSAKSTKKTIKRNHCEKQGRNPKQQRHPQTRKQSNNQSVSVAFCITVTSLVPDADRSILTWDRALSFWNQCFAAQGAAGEVGPTSSAWASNTKRGVHACEMMMTVMMVDARMKVNNSISPTCVWGKSVGVKQNEPRNGNPIPHAKCISL